MKNWDYNLPKNWRPLTPAAWVWYLERKINYGDWRGLNLGMIKKYWRRLKLDPGIKLLFQNFFDVYGVK